MHRAVLTGVIARPRKAAQRDPRLLHGAPPPPSVLLLPPHSCFLNKRKVFLYYLITRVGIFSENQERATPDERMHVVQGEKRDCGRFAFQT